MKKNIICVLCAVFLIASTVAIAETAVPIDTADIAWATEAIDYVTLGICLFAGLLIKHCTPLDNKYIPLIVAALGLGIAIWTNVGTGITPTVILSGLISGVASTGFHQVFRQLFSNS